MQVLHKFLEVFSAFDWDTYALSLQGPIRLTSFPNAKRARPHAWANPFLHPLLSDVPLSLLS